MVIKALLCSSPQFLVRCIDVENFTERMRGEDDHIVQIPHDRAEVIEVFKAIRFLWRAFLGLFAEKEIGNGRPENRRQHRKNQDRE